MNVVDDTDWVLYDWVGSLRYVINQNIEPFLETQYPSFKNFFIDDLTPGQEYTYYIYYLFDGIGSHTAGIGYNRNTTIKVYSVAE